MREISYTRDRRRRMLEFPAKPGQHGPIYQIEALAIVAGVATWKPIGRLVTNRGVAFARDAWDAAHRAMITGTIPKALPQMTTH